MARHGKAMPAVARTSKAAEEILAQRSGREPARKRRSSAGSGSELMPAAARGATQARSPRQRAPSEPSPRAERLAHVPSEAQRDHAEARGCWCSPRSTRPIEARTSRGKDPRGSSRATLRINSPPDAGAPCAFALQFAPDHRCWSSADSGAPGAGDRDGGRAQLVDLRRAPRHHRRRGAENLSAGHPADRHRGRRQAKARGAVAPARRRGRRGAGRAAHPAQPDRAARPRHRAARRHARLRAAGAAAGRRDHHRHHGQRRQAGLCRAQRQARAHRRRSSATTRT